MPRMNTKPIPRNRAKVATQAKAKRAVKKAKAATETKAKDTAVLRKLTPIAKEINVRLEKAEKSDALAVDHRLAASLRLAEAKKMIEASDIRFKTWCEGNLKAKYETVRQLVRIGASDDPYAALTNVRESDKKSKQISRNKKASEIISERGAAVASSIDVAAKAVAALGDKGALNLAMGVATEAGMAVVSKSDNMELKSFRKQAKQGPGLKAVMAAFDALKPAEKMKLAEYAAKKVGVELVKPTFDDPLALPKGLDRRKT